MWCPAVWARRSRWLSKRSGSRLMKLIDGSIGQSGEISQHRACTPHPTVDHRFRDRANARACTVNTREGFSESSARFSLSRTETVPFPLESPLHDQKLFFRNPDTQIHPE